MTLAAPFIVGRRSSRLRRERWFAAVFVLLLLAFLIILIVQPSAVGRGGR